MTRFVVDKQHWSLVLVTAAVATGCTRTWEYDPFATGTGGVGTHGAAESGETTTGAGGDTSGATTSGGADGPMSPVKFDVGVPDTPGSVCAAPDPVSCDHVDDDPWHALGLDCPGGPGVDGQYDGSALALHVHEGDLGTHDPPPYPPREGSKLVILSTGVAQDLTVAGRYASTDLLDGIDPPAGTLPAPLRTTSVSAADDCLTDPGLVGTGDCSNTIEGQWSQGSGEAHDYAELRFSATVPGGTTSFSYDFAMFSTEYPVFYHTQYNDMYVAWLQSEQWTGNVSFDAMGNPISLNAGFLDYKDAPNGYDCPDPCEAPELQGTAMEGHAGTRWLTTTAPVTPGEDIEVVFAVFDLSDGILDTAVILDNVQWGCEGGSPVTIPG